MLFNLYKLSEKYNMHFDNNLNIHLNNLKILESKNNKVIYHKLSYKKQNNLFPKNNINNLNNINNVIPLANNKINLQINEKDDNEKNLIIENLSKNIIF